MMAGWGVFGVNEEEFLASAALLAIYDPSQHVKEHPGDDGSSPASSWNEELDKDDASMVCETSASDTGVDSVMPKFLDRIAELLAKQKTSKDKSRQQRRAERPTTQDADHVTAAGFLRGIDGTQAQIILAKNGEFDEDDRKMVQCLQTWLQMVALTKKCPSTKTDRLWKQMVDFYHSRLSYYIEELTKFQEEQVINAYGGDIEPVKELRDRCVSYLDSENRDNAFEDLHEIILLAYDLRYREQSTPTEGKAQRARNLVSFLGRLRSAYESFKAMAMGLSDSRDICGSIKIILISAPKPKEQSMLEIRKRIDVLAFQCRLSPPRQGQLNEALGKSKSIIKSYYHAEMQVLMYLEASIESRLNPYPYLGCSKKSCWLCGQIIERYTSKGSRDTGPGFYGTRGSHGHIYPRWTLGNLSDPVISFYLSSTIMDVFRSMKSKLSQSAFVHRDPIAQSSADVTIFQGRVAQQELARRRLKESEVESPRKDKGKAILKKLLFTRRCLCFPADGSEPSFVMIDFFEQPKGYSRAGLAGSTFPDFSDSWGECNLERRYFPFDVENQPIKSVEGSYLLYCCTNDALDDNQNIKRMLSLDVVDFEREFWHGDVFLVRYHEDQETFATTVEDVPVEMLQSNSVRIILAEHWSRDILGEDSKMSAGEMWIDKYEKDKMILKSRMSRSERQTLKFMPPGTLDFLAMTACDDGAYISSSVTSDPNDPSKVKISVLKKKTAVEEMGWNGFSSDQL
ncbi:hypothetical protein GGR54DRAFT_390293 [Hypoxylon sp. NC1633]|nr:hypothetical protein GGR54DRAFT_390293 [Hypoxylon sp. NC1633]